MIDIRFKKLALISLIGFVSPPLYAEPVATEAIDIETITKKWKCKYCPDLSEEPWEGNLEFGIGYVTNDSFKFGEYNGLSEEGFYGAANVEALYRDDEGTYWNIIGNNLGLDSANLGIEGGKQGSYKLKLDIDQITRYQLDTGRTPYVGDGAYQTLPGGWVNAPTTGGMTELANELRPVEFSTERRDIRLGGEFNTSPNMAYGVQFRRQTKKGNLPTGYGFGFTRIAILNKPVDYTTDEVELSARYQSAGYNSKIAFIHSEFKNDSDAFRWQNAFDDPTPPAVPPGENEGQAGTAPDNTMQQLLFTGNYLAVKNWQFTGLLSFAQMNQDEAYLPYTITPDSEINNGPISALPTNSLDGKVYVYNTNLAAHWQAASDLNLHFIFEHHEQDNQTDRNTYTYVTADTTVTTTPRANFPYSFRTQNYKVSADYKIDPKMKLSGGGKLSFIDRDYQAVETTDEGTLWAKFNQRIDNGFQYSIKAEMSDRSIDNYNPNSEVVPADNPLMRKYNMADRKGQKLSFNLGLPAAESFYLGLSGDVARYDYDASQVGLTESNEFSLGLDMQYMVDEDLSFSAFIQNTEIDSDQAGATWTATNDDSVLTFGLGTKYQIIEDTLNVGLDYVRAESESAINISGGTPFPDLTTTRDTVIIYGDYMIDEQFTVKASYQYENYKEENWYIDNVAPDTLANVLSLGEKTPDYSIGAFWVSLKYSF